MLPLTLQELATVTDGKLYLADLPPLDGVQQPVHGIHFDIDPLAPGGLYWDLSTSRESSFGKPELAFAKGAAGVVTCHEPSSPWAGRYSLIVDNCQLALRQLAHYLRQIMAQRVLLLGPSLSQPEYVEALQRSLTIATEQPSPALPFTIGEATYIETHCEPRLSMLQSLHEDSLYATLLVSTPDFLILGRTDADSLNQHSPSAFKRLIHCLPPTGTILYCDLSPAPPVSWAPHFDMPSWSQLCTTAGINYLRIGTDHHADFQMRPISATDTSHILRIDDDWTELPDGSYEHTIVQATAIVAATVLAQSRAA